MVIANIFHHHIPVKLVEMISNDMQMKQAGGRSIDVI